MADEIRKNDDMDRADEAWGEFCRGLEQRSLCFYRHREQVGDESPAEHMG